MSESNPDDQENKIALSIVAKLLTVRSYNFDAMQRTLKRIWALKHDVVFRKIENNLFIIQFIHWRDKEKVLDGAPWNFDNQLLLLGEIHGDEQPDSIELKFYPFWIRLYNLPLDSRSDTDIKTIADKIGAVLEVERDELGWDKSRRVRVLVDTSKPLRRIQKIRNKRGAAIQRRIVRVWQRKRSKMINNGACGCVPPPAKGELSYKRKLGGFVLQLRKLTFTHKPRELKAEGSWKVRQEDEGRNKGKEKIGTSIVNASLIEIEKPLNEEEWRGEGLEKQVAQDGVGGMGERSSGEVSLIKGSVERGNEEGKKASQRRAKNHIGSLVNEEGVRVHDEEGVRHVAVDYFRNLFTTSNPTSFDEALTARWNVSRINELFLPFGGERILSIPISFRLPEDSWCWDLEKNGEYLVRSAYRAIFGDSEDSSLSLSSHTSNVWKEVWHAATLPRIKLFFWRACCGALPTAKGLHRRVQSISPTCSLCGVEDESELHCLRDCVLAHLI
uniref:Reverse transcriptase zinc-binding domain-containing protein n=1 Tax=Chenopodium quinoa TaxID=63459 RepID=A0A803LNC7_CHEQI